MAAATDGGERSKRSIRLRFRDWLNNRTALDQVLREALDEKIPGGAKIAYIFGSGLLFLFLSQVITGVFLALYYVPSADHAHTSLAYIIKVVTSGSFIHSIHAYGSSAIIIVLLLHLSQVYVYGAYKSPRELVWVAGCVLCFLMLGMAFTGYLLPWDQKAYFATTVGTNLMDEIPIIGHGLKLAMRGGANMGVLTVSRFFVWHVFLLPAGIFLFIVVHVYLFRKAGPAGPPSGDPATLRRKAQSFYPRQLGMDLAFALLLILALGSLAHFRPAPLGPVANPADTQYLPRPEWYYRPVFEWLKYWTNNEIVGILVIPSLLVVLFVALPFIGRGPERRPGRRLAAMSALALVLGGAVSMGWLSYRDDSADPAVEAQLRLQQQEEEQYMQAPFKPEVVGANLLPTVPNPLIAKGAQLFASHACSACHGQNGAGTAVAPSLAGIGSKFSESRLEELLRHPTKNMQAGGMPAVTMSPEEMAALLAYLESLH